MPRFIPLVALILVGSLTPAATQAWSTRVHNYICQAAWDLASEDGRDFVRGVRSAAGLSSSKSAFAYSCSWPDSCRRKTHIPSYEYHYVNVQEDFDRLVPDRDCQAYDCVPVGIVRYSVYLHTGTRSRQLREEALRFAAHFIGDVHQPLHAGHSSDLGGNTFSISRIRSGNLNAYTLHSAWDGVLPHAAGIRSGSDVLDHVRSLDPSVVESWKEFEVWDWTGDAYEKAKTYAYSYPSGEALAPGVALPNDYRQAAAPIVREQIAKAAVRLAHLFDTLASGDNPFEGLDAYP